MYFVLKEEELWDYKPLNVANNANMELRLLRFSAVQSSRRDHGYQIYARWKHENAGIYVVSRVLTKIWNLYDCI